MQQLLSFFRRIELPLFALTSGSILLFCITALVDLNLVFHCIRSGVETALKGFGAYWQFLLLASFVVGIFLSLTPHSKRVLGPTQKPEFSSFKWMAMIMCTLLAGGGIFWSAGEPMAHFQSTPPFFETPTSLGGAATAALTQSYLHWGFLGWAILGPLTVIVLMHYHYEKGLPLAPRTLLYPLLGKYALRAPLGTLVDFTCLLAVVAGTVGPIGFLALQLSASMDFLFGLKGSLNVQLLIVWALVAFYTASAASGVNRGIQLLSRINMILGAFLMLYVLITGPTSFIFTSFFESMGQYALDFFPMALYRGDAGLWGDPGWLGSWTLFFWGWFVGYGPIMAIFIARISKGRSIRSIILMLTVAAPLITNFWFTVLGGTGIAFELQQAQPTGDLNIESTLLAITQNLPLGTLISVLFMVLTTIFTATTGDTITYVIADILSKGSQTPVALRIFWGIAMGVLASILIQADRESLEMLQNVIIITAVPVSFVLLPSLWSAVAITLGKRK